MGSWPSEGGMPSPGRQANRRPTSRYGDSDGWAGCGIPSTSPRATTRRPARRLGKAAGGWAGWLRPGHRAVGLCQVDGMPHEPRGGSRSVVRPFVNRSSGRPPAAQNSDKRRAAFGRLSVGAGGVLAGGYDVATRSASTSPLRRRDVGSLCRMVRTKTQGLKVPVGSSRSAYVVSARLRTNPMGSMTSVNNRGWTPL